MRFGALAALMIAVAPADGFAQEVQWTRQFGGSSQDRAFAVAVNASGLYVAGATEGTLPSQRSAGDVDAFVRKYDTHGTEIWTRQFGTAGFDEVLAIAVDESGVYVAGDTQGDMRGRTTATGPAHAFVRKYDFSGSEIWTREFGSGRREEVLAVTVGPNAVFAVGDTTVTTLPYDDGFVAAFDGKGVPTWSRWIATDAVDRASAIAVHASGVYVAGATQGGLPGQTRAGDSDGFLRKYSLDGTEVWTRQFGTSGADEILSMTLDESGLYLAGTTHGALEGSTAAGELDAFAAKFDFEGRPSWMRQFGTAGYDDALGIAVHGQAVYVAGNTMGAWPGHTAAGASDAFVRKHDLAGRPAWTTQFGTGAHDEVLAVAADATGVYVAGVTEGALRGHENHGSGDAFVIKLK
jgi:hypothetical protein